MPRIAYQEWSPRPETLDLIDKANDIIREYMEEGFDLTLRQLYYQMVARDYIPNTQREYKNLGAAINNGRLAGLIDWYSIIDRTRNLRGIKTWGSPSELIDENIKSFAIDLWKNQPCHIEVWVEKDALVDVIAKACSSHRVDHFSCRGYTSQSELWTAARRLARHEFEGQETLIIHLGDHDPSGIDMTRDIEARLHMFGANTEIKRIALNMDQVEEQSPPPNPAKITDSRIKGYIRQYGRESWELDALSPAYLVGIIEDTIATYIDWDVWEQDAAKEEEMIGYLEKMRDMDPYQGQAGGGGVI